MLRAPKQRLLIHGLLECLIEVAAKQQKLAEFGVIIDELDGHSEDKHGVRDAELLQPPPSLLKRVQKLFLVGEHRARAFLVGNQLGQKQVHA